MAIATRLGPSGSLNDMYYVRSLSEVPRQISLMEGRRADTGAVSIEPLEVSRWRGEVAMSYGFSMIVVGVNGWRGAEEEAEKAVEEGQRGTR